MPINEPVELIEIGALAGWQYSPLPLSVKVSQGGIVKVAEAVTSDFRHGEIGSGL